MFHRSRQKNTICLNENKITFTKVNKKEKITFIT